MVAKYLRTNRAKYICCIAEENGYYVVKIYKNKEGGKPICKGYFSNIEEAYENIHVYLLNLRLGLIGD